MSFTSRALSLRAAMATPCGLTYIGLRLGHNWACDRQLAAQLDALTAHHGFPAALPTSSRQRVYCRRAVDAWFAGQLGPVLAARQCAADPATAVAIAQVAGLHRLLVAA